MRELILADLVKDALGPRNGVHEIMHSDPRSEYITGVLAPGTNPIQSVSVGNSPSEDKSGSG